MCAEIDSRFGGLSIVNKAGSKLVLRSAAIIPCESGESEAFAAQLLLLCSVVLLLWLLLRLAVG